MNWNDLIGKKILAFRGVEENIGEKTSCVPLSKVLFDDKETYLSFSEQDPYDYHDCCASARVVSLHKNAKLWESLFNQEGGYKESTTTNLIDPF